METDNYTRHLRDPVSRRRFIAFSGGGLSAAFIAACGDDEDEAGTTTTEEESTGSDTGASGDVDILNAALALEQAAVFAYTAGAGLLGADALAVGEAFLAQEQEHVAGLTAAIGDLGGTAVKPKKDDAYVKELGLDKLKSEEDVLTFALNLENVAIAAYVDAIPKLTAPELRVTGAQIVTNEAEHVSVLLGALGQPQVPEAFVTGDAKALG